MEQNNTPYIKAINRIVYEARIAKNESLLTAARAMNVLVLHLSLVEKGYLHVGKKLRAKMIQHYGLKEEDFTQNSTFVDPITVTVDDPQLEEKVKKKLARKRVKIISGILTLLMIGILSTGIFYFKRNDTNPREVWTPEFTAYRNNVASYPDGKSIAPGGFFREESFVDAYYEQPYALDKYSYPFSEIYIPEVEAHSDCMLVCFKTNINNVRNGVLYGEIDVYNNKKIANLTFYSSNGSETNALVTYNNMNFKDDFILRAIGIKSYNAQGEAETKTYGPDTKEYQDFKDDFFGNNPSGNIFSNALNYIDTNLISKRSQISGYTSVTKLLDDTQKISVHHVSSLRLGMRLMIASAIVLVITVSTLFVGFMATRKPKRKKPEEKPFVVHKVEYTADAAAVYRSIPNDSKFPLVVPEFVIRLFAIFVLMIASIGTILLTKNTLAGGAVMSIEQSINLTSYVNNVFIAGTTLAFILKLDVYHKKTSGQLMDNIFMLFILGAIFYVVVSISYACLSSGGNIINDLFKILVIFIPGNIMWNLMFYSLIFFFLFTIPKNIEDSPHKTLLWRLCSAIPTMLLVAAFVYKGINAGGYMSPYISFLFYTNGALLTFFAIFYLYSLFFLQQYVRLKYGKDFGAIFTESRYYALAKNRLACIVLGVLALIDLLFLFKMPDNSLGFGKNWIVLALIPLILFYRPHIGKRNPKWDNIYMVGYAFSLIFGSIVSIGMILNTSDAGIIKDIIA